MNAILLGVAIAVSSAMQGTSGDVQLTLSGQADPNCNGTWMHYDGDGETFCTYRRWLSRPRTISDFGGGAATVWYLENGAFASFSLSGGVLAFDGPCGSAEVATGQSMDALDIAFPVGGGMARLRTK